MSKQKTYGQLLTEVKSLVQSGRATCYQITKRLMRVFDDPAYREHRQFHGDDEVAESLDEFYADFVLTFAEARTIYRHFPDEPKWNEVSLANLYEQARQKELASKAQEKSAAPAVTRKRATVAELERVVEQKRELEATNRFLQREVSEIDGLRQQLRTANQKIAELETELSERDQRIAELESLLSKSEQFA